MKKYEPTPREDIALAMRSDGAELTDIAKTLDVTKQRAGQLIFTGKARLDKRISVLPYNIYRQVKKWEQQNPSWILAITIKPK